MRTKAENIVGRPTGRLLILLWALLVIGAAGAKASPATTLVQGTVYRADGQAAHGGTVTIQWNDFTSATGDFIFAGHLTATIGSDGTVSIPLVPNTGATPAGSYYRVVVNQTGEQPSERVWVVPAVSTTTPSAVWAKVIPQSVAQQSVGRDYVDTALGGLARVASTGSYDDLLNKPTSFNLSAPGPIGGTTPGTVNATAYSVNGIALASAHLSDSASLVKTTAANTYTQPQTAPSVITSLSPVADVRAYGAKGDGVTDDAPAARAALAAVVSAGGGTVYLPKGNYYFGSYSDGSNNAFLAASASHVHVKCDPGAVINTPAPASTHGTIFYLGYPTGGGIQNKAGYQANTLTLAGSSTITLTTASDTSHFAVGDPIYILGGPGTESNGDGEINWITAIDPVGGVLTLAKPTSKPYTGNLSNVGAPNIVTVMDGAGMFYNDISIDGCTATPGADFAYFGQIIGGKITDNTITIQPTSNRGMIMNSYYPMADVEIAHNKYIAGNGGMLQLADGMRDFYIHDNDCTSSYGGGALLNPSQGVINTHITRNNLYMTKPAGVVNGDALIKFSTAYGLTIEDNFMVMDNQNPTLAADLITVALSNGACVDCIISGNVMRHSGGMGAAIKGNAATLRVVGNHIAEGGYKGIEIDANNSVVADNVIHITGTNTQGISSGARATVTGNYIYADSTSTNSGVVLTNASGDVSHNTFYNLNKGLSLGAGTLPQAIGNNCIGVTVTTNCGSVSVLQDSGANGIVKRTAAGATSNALAGDVTSLFSGTCNSGTFLRGDGSCNTPAGAASSGTAIQKGNGSGGFTSAFASDVYGLFSGTCSASTYLRGDGSCATPSGAGTVTGTGTGSYLAMWTGSGAGQSGLGNANLDDGITTSGTITSTEPLHVTGMPTGCVQYPCLVASVTPTTYSGTAGVGPTTIYTPSAAGHYRACIFGNTTVAGTAGTYALFVNAVSDGHSANYLQVNNISLTSQWTTGQICGSFYADASQPIKYQLYFSGVSGSPTVRYGVTLERLQ